LSIHAMTDSRTIVLVNPWSGTIGPNVGAQQIVAELLARGHEVHLIVAKEDETVGALRSMGSIVHVVDTLELTPRTLHPLRLVRHLRRGWHAAEGIGTLSQQVGADAICINSENMLL